MSLFARWTNELRRLEDEGRYRALRPPAGIDFTSNDYLGYAGRGVRSSVAGVCDPGTSLVPEAPASQRPATERDDLPRSGTASRLLRGDHPVWHEVESALAAWHGAEATLMLTSGYTANEGLLSTAIGPGDWVASDALNHASIGDGLRLVRPRKFIFRHNDLNHLEDGLRSESATRRVDRELFVVTEALFSMDADGPPLRELVELTERYGAHLIVDEAHATGCFGRTGSGRVDEAGVRDRVLATVHTGGKALGVCGAYVCGSALLKELLVNRCRHLIFTTALPPVAAAWWLDALRRVRADDEGRRKLHRNAARFRELLAERGIAAAGSGYVVPVVLGDDTRAVAVAARLQERGYDVRAIRPPSVPEGTARLRISIHTDHTPADLAGLAAALSEAMAE
jgi:8-amino-7-oxononanoate synthase